MWYTAPAENWNEALPAGNGRLGCMMFGGVHQEHFQLNEDSLWSGGPRDRINPDSAGALPQVRRLLREGNIPEAEELALRALSGTPYGQRIYQTLGDLYLNISAPGTVTDYVRSLDLETGTLQVRFDADGTHYSRRAFISYPDNALIIELSAQGKRRMNVTGRMDRERALDCSGRLGNDTIYFTGQTGKDHVAFCCMLRCIQTDGTLLAQGDTLLVENASHATLCLTAGTSFRYSDPFSFCKERLEKLTGQDTAVLYTRHCADFVPHMRQTALILGDPERDLLPTDVRLARYAQGEEDPGLEALYFTFGRYLLLSSSRPGSLPATLQGIWNKEFFPPWDSKYTININIEMNYWPAEACGLGDCHLPLFDHLARMKATGQETARRIYGCRGFTAHHNTDLWADTAPQDQYIPASFWPMGAAWLSTHIWQHYRYTLDKDFLAGHFDTLEQAVLFFVDFLENDSSGYYVTNPSVSPENRYMLSDTVCGCMCIGPTMDMQILRELFKNYLDSAKTLSVENEVTVRAKDILERLRPTQIGSDGRILEWDQEYREAEPGHRHISHLYALAPGCQIHPDRTPELATAARKTLEYRLSHGGGHTGWSRAWITLLWARLFDGAQAYKNLRALLSSSTFPNLMDYHPLLDGQTFQLDGNLGAVAAITELLVQSGEDFVRLLPALPTAWEGGACEGIHLPGAAKISLAWKDSVLTSAQITASCHWEKDILYKNQVIHLSLTPGKHELKL